MIVESIGTVAQPANGLQNVGLQEEDFLQVLLTQLTYQDPLEPMDNTEFIAQFAQLTALAQTQQTNDRLDSLLTLQSANQAVSLLGKTVEVRTDASTLIGDVETISFFNGTPSMVIRDAQNNLINNVTLGQIAAVR